MEKDKTPHGTFTQLPNVFIDLCDISDEAYRLYTKLYREYGTRGGVYTGSLRKLADLLAINKDKIHRNLRALTAADLIGMNTANNQLTVTLHVDDLWQLNTLAKLGEHIPRWTNLKETLATVSDLRQERLKNETVLSQIHDNNDESVSDLRQHEEDIKPPVGQDKQANSKPCNTERDKTISNTSKTVANRSSQFTSEQLRIDTLYCALSDVTQPPQVTDQLKKYWDKLDQYIATQEDMISLYDHTKRDCATKKNKRVYPGNLADCVIAWHQEEEEKRTPLPWSQPDESSSEPTEEPNEPMHAGKPLFFWTEETMAAAELSRNTRKAIRTRQQELAATTEPVAV